MPNEDMFSDEYIARLVATDAKDCSLKYSAVGMEAYRPDKNRANMPKPNKRFLRHIIKDTDTHNKNLLAKEAAESRARLKDLEQAEEIKRLKTNPNASDIRRRQMGDIQAILGTKKRTRGDDDSTMDSRRTKPRKGGDEHRSTDRHKLSQDASISEGKGRRTSRASSERSSSRRTHEEATSTSERRSRRDERRRKHSERSGSSREEGDSKAIDGRRERYHAQNRERTHDRDRRKDHEDEEHEEYGSDSSGEAIGPRPAQRHRGRGALGSSSGIDWRFSKDYNPEKDLDVNN